MFTSHHTDRVFHIRKSRTTAGRKAVMVVPPQFPKKRATFILTWFAQRKLTSPSLSLTLIAVHSQPSLVPATVHHCLFHNFMFLDTHRQCGDQLQTAQTLASYLDGDVYNGIVAPTRPYAGKLCQPPNAGLPTMPSDNSNSANGGLALEGSQHPNGPHSQKENKFCAVKRANGTVTCWQ